MTQISYIITDNNITVNYSGQTHIVSRKDKLANQLIEAVKNKDMEQIPKLVSIAKRVEEFGKGNFTIQNDRIFVSGVAIPDLLSRKIIQFMSDGLPFEPLVKFANNLLKNPSYRAVNELFQFLEKNDHPITANGNIICYKKVTSDFKDGYTKTFDNSPGTVVEVPRNQVDEDSSKTCSYGLHIANWHYAKNVYSAGDNDIMLEVEVNPADVVAVPADYNQSKIRVCAYKVLGIVDKQHSTNTIFRATAPEETLDHDTTCKECDSDLLDDEECYYEEHQDDQDQYPWEDEII